MNLDFLSEIGYITK